MTKSDHVTTSTAPTTKKGRSRVFYGLFAVCVLDMAGAIFVHAVPEYQTPLIIGTLIVIFVFTVIAGFALESNREIVNTNDNSGVQADYSMAKSDHVTINTTSPAKHGHWLDEHLGLVGFVVFTVCVIDIIALVSAFATSSYQDPKTSNILLTMLVGTGVLILVFEMGKANIKASESDIQEDYTVPKTDYITTNTTRVNNPIVPTHYQSPSGKDLISVMADIYTPEEFRGFMKGNIWKYTERYERKNRIQDLQKAQEYLRRLIKYEVKREEKLNKLKKTKLDM